MRQYLLLASILVIGVAGYSQVKADSFFVNIKRVTVTDTINGRFAIVAERDSSGVWNVVNASRALEVAYQTSLRTSERHEESMERLRTLCNSALKVIYSLGKKGMVVRGYKKDIKHYNEVTKIFWEILNDYLWPKDRPLIIGSNPVHQTK